jgi:hypothetical protein
VLAIRLRRLIKIRYARDSGRCQRLYLELLTQKGQAVAAGLGVQCVWRVVELEALRLAHYTSSAIHINRAPA